MSTYAEFLERKETRATMAGRIVSTSQVHESLHPWQAELVTWACSVGRAALWADTGLGKTRMQVEWSRLMGSSGLIAAPLAVCRQTVREAQQIGVPLSYVRSPDEITGNLSITNYEMLDRFSPESFDTFALDESSILKDFNSKTRNQMIEWAATIPYRLACSATPAPNDVAELANHSEFLGQATRTEMLATYFIHDSDGWRLKGHARRPMFTWMSTWARAIRKPSDMGYSDDGYVLPPLNIEPHLLDVDITPEGELFATDLGGVGGRAAVRKQTLTARVGAAVDRVLSEPDEPWLIWTGLNDEAELLAKSIPGSVNVTGDMTPEAKADALLGFADGEIRTLITKPKIAARGMNWQHCARMAFVGLSDSYEDYYQAIRRCYRYGQTRPVQAHIFLSNLEAQIAANVARKEREAGMFTAQLVQAMQGE